MKTILNAEYRFQSLVLTMLPLRSDNYSYIIHDESTGETLVIDPSETAPIIEWLHQKKMGLTWILDTHHHNDHIEGNPGLKDEFKARIAASAYDIEKGRITGKPDRELKDGETFVWGKHGFQVIATPGHTLGHVCLFLEGANWLFSGDTLFSLGCGRLFEGTGPMLWDSFLKLRNLPDETLVFCGHEYTEANARFVESIAADLPGFSAHKSQLALRLKEEQKTIPSRLGDEKVFNPYFLADSPYFKRYGNTAAEVFTHIRALKDQF